MEIYMKKRFLAMGVCLAVLFCSFTPVQPVNAAAKTVNVTVRYKGKNVTFESYRNSGSNSKYKYILKAKTYAAVKKAWGKANKVETFHNAEDDIYYTWKSGKTSISFNTYGNGKRRGGISIDIQNKKASLWGIKVGMSKKQALQKLKKQFGKKNVTTQKRRV